MKIVLRIVFLITLLNASHAVCMLGKIGKVAMHARSCTYARSSFSSKSNAHALHELERRMHDLYKENERLYQYCYGDLTELNPHIPDREAQNKREKNFHTI